jgi:hypothetical protein
MVLLQIRCNCGELIKETDLIIIDEINTLSHKACQATNLDYIKAVGSYKEIAEKFPFFYEKELFS